MAFIASAGSRSMMLKSAAGGHAELPRLLARFLAVLQTFVFSLAEPLFDRCPALCNLFAVRSAADFFE
jgi:hypothetical protein